MHDSQINNLKENCALNLSRSLVAQKVKSETSLGKINPSQNIIANKYDAPLSSGAISGD